MENETAPRGRLTAVSFGKGRWGSRPYASASQAIIGLAEWRKLRKTGALGLIEIRRISYRHPESGPHRSGNPTCGTGASSETKHSRLIKGPISTQLQCNVHMPSSCSYPVPLRCRSVGRTRGCWAWRHSPARQPVVSVAPPVQ